jgi:hypothetical protein
MIDIKAVGPEKENMMDSMKRGLRKKIETTGMNMN